MARSTAKQVATAEHRSPNLRRATPVALLLCNFVAAHALIPRMAQHSSSNKLFYGDNLHVLREHIADESLDLIYLDLRFNSKHTDSASCGDLGGGQLRWLPALLFDVS